MNKFMALGLASALLLLSGLESINAAPVPLDVTDGGKKMSGDPATGKQIFNRCMVCHSIDAGVNHIGPSLHGVVNRPAGTVANFSYSGANKKSGIVWSQQKIYDYLKNPQAMVPGTKMTFPGLTKGQDRADVIAYLTQNSK
jgi:cytochrome c